MDMQTWRDARERAVDAAEAVRVALAALGLPENVWRGVRPVVTHKGTAYVHVGMVSADAAERLAEAVRPSASADR
ncbi:hypothetical protein BJP39_06385 [Streptomyces sp. CC77]|nr:hypothetical protein BJP39_06385 [Streptomyces sp. CC77]